MKNSPRYKPYPLYKNSGVEWLGRIPNDGQLRKLKFAATPDSRGSFGIKGNLGLDERDDLFPAFSAAGQDIWVERADYEEPGIVLSAIGARCGKCFKADGKWSALANTQVFLPKKTFFRDYVWYLVNREAFWQKGGSAQPYVQIPASMNQMIPFPSFSEQRAVAGFLDRETVKIDELIARKERLIELLEEKRAALITHAVTRGLSPDAPLRESNIEWLGKIPERWVPWKLSHFAPIVTCGVAATPEYVVDGVPFLSAQNVKAHEIVFENFKLISPETHKALTKYRRPIRGDILLSRVGTIGEAAVVNTDRPFSIFVSLTHIRVNPQRCLNRYLVYYFDSVQFKEFAKVVTAYGGGVGNLNVNDLTELRIPLPPLGEQNAIVEYLDNETAKIGAIIATIEQAIEHLQEYRAALITAAVTGKIDVRDEVKAAA
jgi:type I restriction enzyme S subunit